MPLRILSTAPGPPPSDDETAAVRPVDVAPSGVTAADEFGAFLAAHSADLLRPAFSAWARTRRDPLPYTRRMLVNLRVDTWRRRRREVLLAPSRMPDVPHETAGTTHDRDQLVRALPTLRANLTPPRSDS